MKLRRKRMLLLRSSLAMVVLVALFVRPGWPPNAVTPLIMEGVGYLFLLAGLGIRMWSILYIGGRKSKELISEGPYSLCRHPLYLGSVLVGIGTALCFENVILLVLGLVLLVPIHLVVAAMEDRHLLEVFGDEYAEYAHRVPSFLPRLSGYRAADVVTISVRSVRRASIDAMAIMLIPLIEDLLEMLHDHGIIPVFLHFPT